MKIIFFRLLDIENKAETLLLLIDNIRKSKNVNDSIRAFILDEETFNSIPNRPLSYWIPPKVIDAYKHLQPFSNWCIDSGSGITSGNDERFLRLWWEVPSENVLALRKDISDSPEKIKQKKAYEQILNGQYWVPFYKGGRYVPFYLEAYLVINWNGLGAEVRSFPGSSVPNQHLYFLPGIGFLRRTTIRLCATCLPYGTLFSSVSPVFLPRQGKAWKALSILNSLACETLLSVFQTRGASGDDQTKIYELGLLSTLPVPLDDNTLEDSKIAEIVKVIISIQGSNEISHFFSSSPSNNQELLIEKLFENEIMVTSSYDWIIKDLVNTESLESFSEAKMKNEIKHNLFVSLLTKKKEFEMESVISYAIGCVYGRWIVKADVDDGFTETLPDPFAPLPACSPSMLKNKLGLPASREEVHGDYPIRISWEGILVNDESHNENIDFRLREALNAMWSLHAEEIEQEICEIFHARSLRDYINKPTLFFAKHLSQYSKSHRAAPIYWPLSTPSCSYTLWLYYHRLNDQTLFTCVNDFVDPKLKQVFEEATRLRFKQGRSIADEKELERLMDFEHELKDFRKELLRVASFWKPNLNDGVEITASPLWKLFQHKPWQKRLKATWQKLEAGEYDWAHLAYSIWPERVREKCRSDKSLAIAHDLEELFVELPVNTKKKRAKKTAVENEETEGLFDED